MTLTYQENYWDNPERKAAFQRYLIEVFGLDLSLWDKTGFWDHRYRPFSFFDRNKVVSNVNVYTMCMIVAGRLCQAAQLSAVGTLPEYRRRGLGRQLTEKAIEWARRDHEFFFLFADDHAFRFYEHCGFHRVEEFSSRITAPVVAARPGVVKLNMQNTEHLALTWRIASTREPVSDRLGVSNSKLFMFWCLHSLNDHIYYLPEPEILVLYKRDNGRVTVFDIVGKNLPAFAEMYSYILDEQDKAIEFLFMVDKLRVGDVDPVRIEGNGTHVRGSFPLEGTMFAFPFTSHA
jgi:GNAT superfamily N-acetyltransferase